VVVGVLIGNAVRRYGGQQGGWIFQGIAIVMTYLCLAFSFLPDVLHASRNGGEEGSLGYWLLFAYLFVASPVLVSVQSILGALINGFAFYQAGKVNKRAPLVLAGPLHLSTGAVSVPSYEVPASG